MFRAIRLLTACTALLVFAQGELPAGVIIEDFESGNLSAYTKVGTGTSDFVSGAYARDGLFGLGTSSGNWLYRDDASVALSQGDTVSAWIKFVGSLGGRAYFGFGSSPAGTLSFVLAPNTGDIRFQENNAFGFTQLDTSPQSFVANRWYRAEVIWGLGGNLTGNLYDSDGVTLLNTVNSSSSLFTSGGIAFRGFDGIKAFDTIERSGSSPVVPEPCSVAVFGIGMCVAGVSAGRRRRKPVVAG